MNIREIILQSKIAMAICGGLALWALTGSPAGAQSAGPERSKHVQATLISAQSSLQPGTELQLGLLLKHDRKWHTYWINPGDAGLPTRIEWTMPAGFKAGEFQWPHPERISAPPLMSYGYGGKVLLPVKIKVPSSARPGTRVKIGAHARWLECADICIPGEVRFQLELPVTEKAEPSKRWADEFAAMKKRLPSRADKSLVTARVDDKHVLVSVKATGESIAAVRANKAYFFPHQKELIAYGEPQRVYREGDSLNILLKRDPNGEKLPNRFSGVLLTGIGEPASIEVGAKLRGVASISAAGSGVAGEGGTTLWTAIFFSLIGGLILNLMPCVLPVLSLKVLSFVKKSGESRGRLMIHGGMYAAGVLTSFWVLAGVMLALRAGGTSLGWGFQLQSPLFVSALAAFIFLFALNQLGVFEMGTSLTRLGSATTTPGGPAGESTDTGSMSGSFLAGILAVVVATPCTAPFMGSALGFALARPALDALLIFTFLGIGLALPYVLLAAFPAALRFLPKPGPWMESLKHFMGFLLLGTVVWLLWVLGRLAGVDILSAMLAVLVLIGVGAWVLGRWTTPTRGAATRFSARVAALVLLLIAGGLAYGSVTTLARSNSGNKSGSGTTADGWIKFSPERVAQLRKQGTPVFIDFTADWCLSCKANKAVALNATSVKNKFRELGVVTMQADWTRRDDVITRTLREFGRSGVPLYVLYGRVPGEKPQILPELLTPDIVLGALKKVGPKK